MSQALNTLGTVANVFGIITPAKDGWEVLKAITNSIEEVSSSLDILSKRLTNRALRSNGMENQHLIGNGH